MEKKVEKNFEQKIARTSMYVDSNKMNHPQH